MANKLLINYVLEYLLSAVFPFPFSKHLNTCFAISFCILAFPLQGVYYLFLFYILFPNNLVTNIFTPAKQGIYLKNSIRPPVSILQIGQILSSGFLHGLE